jgi:hypothetical protein
MLNGTVPNNLYRQAASRPPGGIQTSRKREKDPDRIDPESMTEEEYRAAIDKKYPRLSEPDEEGIDLNPADPRRRFIATCEGVTFYKPSPITEEEKAEAEAAIPVLNKNTCGRRLNFLIFRNNFISLST